MFNYKDIKINYKDFGNKDGLPIVYLHGWGQNIAMMEPIAKPFTKTHRLIILDLPGFGESDEPTYAWTLEDYVDMIHALLEKLKIDKPNLIGHSFGGKLSILYASKYPTSHLILLASPFEVKIKEESKKLKLLKKLKKAPVLNKVADFAKSHMGSTDYKNASPMMREVLVKHINNDVTEAAKKITCPTIIIWGTNDAAVPYEDAFKLEKLIKDSAVVTYENCTHYAYLERLGQTNAIIASFIK